MTNIYVSPDVGGAATILSQLEDDKFEKCLKIAKELLGQNLMIINFTKAGIGTNIEKAKLMELSKRNNLELDVVYNTLTQVSTLLGYILRDNLNAEKILGDLFKKNKKRLEKIQNLVTESMQNRYYFQISAKGNYFNNIVWEINRKEYPREDIRPIKTATIQIDTIDGQENKRVPIIFECEPQDVKIIIDHLQKLLHRLNKVK